MLLSHVGENSEQPYWSLPHIDKTQANLGLNISTQQPKYFDSNIPQQEGSKSMTFEDFLRMPLIL